MVRIGSLKFNWNEVIQICIAMSDKEDYKFNNILRQIIENSLFTERQIEIILNRKNLVGVKFNISKGAFYREVSQSRKKLVSFFYSVILLRSLGIILPDDIDVITRLSEQVSVIKDSDVFAEREDQVISVIDAAIKRLTSV